tara:strand:+ start:593 stop:829 length:237 start_codon:yes stop_codon:yes gene_type:complete
MNTEVKYDQQEKMYSIMKYLNAEKAYFLEMIHFPLKKYDEIERNLRQIIHESSMNLPLQSFRFQNFHHSYIQVFLDYC